MKELFTFDDVLIAPKFSLIESRKDVSLKTNIRGLEMDLPVISANMDTITGSHMASTMLDLGAQACLHRFGSIEDTVKMLCASMGFGTAPMVSIGLGSTELERAEALYGQGAHTFVIDVAHGAQISVVRQAKALREILGSNVNIVVGNFASADTIETFLDYCPEVDAFKIGIGPGSACTTRMKTGVGYPQLSAVLEIAQLLKNTNIKVIADGGMKKPGDIAKALAAGAHMVMLGGMLAGTDETPGDRVCQSRYGTLIIDDTYPVELPAFKKYRGSASQESYEAQGKLGMHRTAEGESFLVPYKGPVKDVLQDIEGGVRSSMTYVGAQNLREFHANVEFIRISSATLTENGAHGKK